MAVQVLSQRALAEKARPMRRIKAKLGEIKPNWFAQHEVDAERVASLVRYIKRGGELAPVVVVDYGGEYMPIDGHHRLSACERLGRRLMAWIIPADLFEALDIKCRDRGDFERAEDFIDCGGKSALEVAPRR